MSEFDHMGLAVDWMDACRRGDLEALLDLYASDARLECRCDGTRLYHGRNELKAYWAPRLGAFSAAGFGLEEITPTPGGVDLEYSIAGSLRIRASFDFGADGKIVRTRCTAAHQDGDRCPAC